MLAFPPKYGTPTWWATADNARIRASRRASQRLRFPFGLGSDAPDPVIDPSTASSWLSGLLIQSGAFP